MIAKKEVFLPSQRNTGFGMQVGTTRGKKQKRKEER